MNIQSTLGITGDETDDDNHAKWDYFRENPIDYSDKLLYGSHGPWPTPAPGRPLSEVAEVTNLPKQELDDWKQNVSPKYIKILIKNFSRGFGGPFLNLADVTKNTI